MAQHDYVIDNGPGLAVRTDINAMAAAIKSSNSGSVAPASPAPGQLWFDTTSGALNIRNTGNTAWAPLSGLSTDGLYLDLKTGGSLRGRVQAYSTGNRMTLQPADTGGTVTGYFDLRNNTSYFYSIPTINIQADGDRSLYFRNLAGTQQGSVINQHTTGAMYIRAFNADASAYKQFVVYPTGGVDATGYMLTMNAGGISGDVEMRHRVSSTRQMRWYYNTVGDIYLQESDDNYGSHFINVLTYVRSSNQVNFGGWISTNGFLLTGTGGNNNGLFNGTGDGATLTSYNVMLRSWYGIGFPSSLDNINRIWMNTRNGDMGISARLYCNDVQAAGNIYVGNGSSTLQTDGNIIFSGGMTVLGGSLYDALNYSRTTEVYNGSDANNTNFPVGTPILAAGDMVRNTAYAIYLQAGNSVRYTAAAGGAQLAGTWRAHGVEDQSGTRQSLMQRTA